MLTSRAPWYFSHVVLGAGVDAAAERVRQLAIIATKKPGVRHAHMGCSQQDSPDIMLAYSYNHPVRNGYLPQCMRNSVR